MYSQSKKQSETEKKLQALRMQLYGKSELIEGNKGEKPSSTKQGSSAPISIKSSSTFTFSSSPNNISRTGIVDNSHLKHDLVKTLIFASFAIGIQLLLYFSLNKFRF